MGRSPTHKFCLICTTSAFLVPFFHHQPGAVLFCAGARCTQVVAVQAWVAVSHTQTHTALCPPSPPRPFLGPVPSGPAAPPPRPRPGPSLQAMEEEKRSKRNEVEREEEDRHMAMLQEQASGGPVACVCTRVVWVCARMCVYVLGGGEGSGQEGRKGVCAGRAGTPWRTNGGDGNEALCSGLRGVGW